ncbi:MAG: hypothetical protein QM534_07250 [Sediminibacterium sp.]|nr:hypothetical protein [Sediminibacterium sp.]
MKKTLLILSVTTLTAVLTASNSTTKNPQTIETNQSTDTVQTGQIHPIIKNIFHNLPLEKSRLDLREVILNDKRFVLTDTTFNNYKPSTFFKGVTTDKGLIKSNPDSIQVMLFLGNTSLPTEKGGEADFKDIMLLNFKYFYSSKDNVEIEYKRILNMLYPILKDSSSEKSESPYSNGNVSGQMTVISEIFQNYNPYYRVGISSISKVSSDNSKSIFTLDIVFSKEDK